MNDRPVTSLLRREVVDPLISREEYVLLSMRQPINQSILIGYLQDTH
jgi:hypothetical protein